MSASCLVRKARNENKIKNDNDELKYLVIETPTNHTVHTATVPASSNSQLAQLRQAREQSSRQSSQFVTLEAAMCNKQKGRQRQKQRQKYRQTKSNDETQTYPQVIDKKQFSRSVVRHTGTSRSIL